MVRVMVTYFRGFEFKSTWHQGFFALVLSTAVSLIRSLKRGAYLLFSLDNLARGEADLNIHRMRI